MSKLIKSMTVEQFIALIAALEHVMVKEEQRLDVGIDYSYYRGNTSLHVAYIPQARDDADRFIQVSVPNNHEDRLVVAYFGSKEALNSLLPRTTESAGKELAIEFTHNRMSPSRSDFHHDKRMAELAMHMIHFLRTGEIFDQQQWQEKFPILHTTVENVSVPKLK